MTCYRHLLGTSEFGETSPESINDSYPSGISGGRFASLGVQAGHLAFAHARSGSTSVRFLLPPFDTDPTTASSYITINPDQQPIRDLETVPILHKHMRITMYSDVRKHDKFDLPPCRIRCRKVASVVKTIFRSQ